MYICIYMKYFKIVILLYYNKNISIYVTVENNIKESPEFFFLIIQLYFIETKKLGRFFK